MNKSKIEWCDYTWNPVTGCLHGCSYCYARRFAERGLGEYGKHPKGERFTPRFHPERLDEPAKRKQPAKIFACSMADLFGYWNDRNTIMEVLRAAGDAPWHTYIWLTKSPDRIPLFNPYWSEIDWVGVTVDVAQRQGTALYYLNKVQGAGVRFISFEPLLAEQRLLEINHAEFLDWIIIGAQTGPGAVKPEPEWVQGIIDFADAHGIPVFLKNNLNWPETRQEFPEVTQ